MADRHEAQMLLDSASKLLGGTRTVPVVALLDTAAAFFRMQAKSPPGGGTAELLPTADALEALAGRIARGTVVRAAELRSLSALANLAEAERHGGLASVAWSTRSKESASDELLMAADHVERAASDGDVAMPQAMRRLLAEMRELAVDLLRTPGADVRALDEPLADLHLQITELRGRLAPPSPTPQR